MGGWVAEAVKEWIDTLDQIVNGQIANLNFQPKTHLYFCFGNLQFQTHVCNLSIRRFIRALNEWLQTQKYFAIKWCLAKSNIAELYDRAKVFQLPSPSQSSSQNNSDSIKSFPANQNRMIFYLHPGNNQHKKKLPKKI